MLLGVPDNDIILLPFFFMGVGMKALLVERSDRAAIILLPNGQKTPDRGEPKNVAIELDGDNLRAWIITSDELEQYLIIRETEVDNQLVSLALGHMNASREFELRKLALKTNLLNQEVAKNCDAWYYLEFGSISL